MEWRRAWKESEEAMESPLPGPISDILKTKIVAHLFNRDVRNIMGTRGTLD
jgi:hypothetical protein